MATSPGVQKRTLRRWRESKESRSQRICAAYVSGMTVMQIHRESGISRNTIYAALRAANLHPRKEVA